MTFDENKYICVKNILGKDVCEISKVYALYDRMNDFSPDANQVIGQHCKYADSLMESLLLFLRPEIEKQTNKKLIPTYSFYRVYLPGSILKDHMDRPSCEISATVTLGFKYIGKKSDYRWCLHGYVNDEKRYIRCDVGDAIIYKGCELTHGRDLFDADPGSYHVQVFLHYVDANGPYAKEYKFDKREAIGIKK